MHRGVLVVEILALAIASLGARNGSLRVPASRVSGIPVVKSPPRTIRFKGWSADNRHWGFYNVTTSTFEGVEAIRSDDSLMISYSVDVRKHWIFEDLHFNIARLSLIPEKKRIFINFTGKTVSERRGADINRAVEILDRKWWTDDPQCERTSLYYFNLHGFGWKHRSSTASYAGIATVGFTAAEGRNSVQAYFAPSRGCEILYALYLTTNQFGIPTSLSVKEVVSYQMGEPTLNSLKYRSASGKFIDSSSATGAPVCLGDGA